MKNIKKKQDRQELFNKVWAILIADNSTNRDALDECKKYQGEDEMHEMMASRLKGLFEYWMEPDEVVQLIKSGQVEKVLAVAEKAVAMRELWIEFCKEFINYSIMLNDQLEYADVLSSMDGE